MFSLDFLHEIRDAELRRIAAYFTPGARVLELGGGTGYQARALADLGFEIVSVDLAGSQYAADRVFPVAEYDGVNLPFADRSFEIVFSSNVLEHVVALAELQREIRRVLRPGGYCVHVLPTATWRAWSNATHFVHHISKSAHSARNMVGALARRRVIGAASALGKMLKHGVRAWIPARHGETGTALTELYRFSRQHWLRRFANDGYEVVRSEPMQLFYTGYSVVGERWSVAKRERLARYLGSSCVVYVVRPADRAATTSA